MPPHALKPTEPEAPRGGSFPAMGMNDVRYLACPECGTWTTRTAEWLAEHSTMPCYQCGTPIEVRSEPQAELDPAQGAGGTQRIR